MAGVRMTVRRMIRALFVALVVVLPVQQAAVEPAAAKTYGVQQIVNEHHHHKQKHAAWMVHKDGKLVVDAEKLGEHMVNIHFGHEQWPAFHELIWIESGWQPFDAPGVPNFNNTGSGACGLTQALPCTKIKNPKSIKSQLNFGMWYIDHGTCKRRGARYVGCKFRTPHQALMYHYATGAY